MDAMVGDDVVHSEGSQRCRNGEEKLVRNAQMQRSWCEDAIGRVGN